MYYYFWFYCFKYSYCHGFFQQNMISFLCKGNRRFLKLKLRYTLNWMYFLFLFCFGFFFFFFFFAFCGLYFLCAVLFCILFAFVFFLSGIFFTRGIPFYFELLKLKLLRVSSFLCVPIIACTCNMQCTFFMCTDCCLHSQSLAFQVYSRLSLFIVYCFSDVHLQYTVYRCKDNCLYLQCVVYWVYRW